MATQGMTIFPGSRRPLLYAAGGVAILLALPRREAFAIARRNLRSFPEYALGSERGLLRMMRRSAREGLAVNEGEIVPGINALGLALCHANGEVFGSISIAAPQDILKMDRIEDYRAMLEDAARHLWARTMPHKPLMHAAPQNLAAA